MCVFLIKTTSIFHCFSTDNGQKRIKKYPFSNKNALVWMGPEYFVVTGFDWFFAAIVTGCRIQANNFLWKNTG